jgi:hypothetical protein
VHESLVIGVNVKLSTSLASGSLATSSWYLIERAELGGQTWRKIGEKRERGNERRVRLVIIVCSGAGAPTA